MSALKHVLPFSPSEKISINFESRLVLSHGRIHCQFLSLEKGGTYTTVVLLNFTALRKAVTPPNSQIFKSTTIFCGIYSLEATAFLGITPEILNIASQVEK